MRRAIAIHTRGHWPEEVAVDSVTLAFLDRHRRRIRLVADSGTPFLLDLPRAKHIAEGDGLELDNGGYVRVRSAPEPVIEITADSPIDLLRIAWHLGNRHLPTQIVGKGLRIRRDHVIEAMVKGLGARVIEIEAPFDPEGGAYASAGHDHGQDDHRNRDRAGHDHAHDHGHHHHHDEHGEHEHDHGHSHAHDHK